MNRDRWQYLLWCLPIAFLIFIIVTNKSDTSITATHRSFFSFQTASVPSPTSTLTSNQSSTSTPTSGPSPTSTSTSGIPRLRPSYNGTSTKTNSAGGSASQYTMQLTVSNETTAGNITGIVTYDNSTTLHFTCTGTITDHAVISLNCTASTISLTLKGSLFSDGHLELTETDSDGGIYNDVLHPNS